jgi:hypothetical protein
MIIVGVLGKRRCDQEPIPSFQPVESSHVGLVFEVALGA